MAENQSTMLTATQAKFQAQEQLGNMPIGQVDIEALLKEWRAENPEAAELNETDVAALNSLFQARRDLLGEVSSAALVQAQESESLSAVQESVLKTTTSLNDILDQNLLWLPSVNAIDFQWPQRIIRGTQTVFSGQNFGRVLSVFGDQLQRLWLVVLLAGILVGTALLARRRLRLDIIRSAQLVGRVQKDDYWVTPNVIILCAMITAPIPIILLLVGFMFRSSGAPDVFITSLGQTGIELSGFTWFFLMWKEWSRDKSLFAAHYKMPSEVGKTVSEQLKWFIPVAGVLIALVTLTQNSREPDVYEGFSLLVFIMTACALAYFGFKILWLKQPTIRKAL